MSFLFFSSRRRHTRSKRDWSSDVCSSDLAVGAQAGDGVVDVVDGEHDAMQAQRVGRKVLRLSAGRRGGVVLGQLQLARSEERRVGKECGGGWWAGHVREESREESGGGAVD